MRTLKQTMKMEHLTSKTPEMLRKELWAHLLGYNLIRSVQARAALEHGSTPDRLSFAAAMQHLEAKRDLLTSTQGEDRRVVLRSLWQAIAQRRVGNRPNRVEPRQVKKGPKAYTKLRVSRRQAIAELLRVWEEEAAAEAARELEAAAARDLEATQATEVAAPPD